ncbi:hypothetical protein PENSPDRAFT_758451 [Peniophora sp. CONT]|nr:hypothetical protein PENSPDRAFT_758451 [Peniophora sp. CONT]
MSKFFSKLSSRRQSSETNTSPTGTPRASRDRAVTLPSNSSSLTSTPTSERPPPPPLPPRVQVTAARSPSPASSGASGPHVTVVPPSPSSISASVLAPVPNGNKPNNHDDDDSSSSSDSVNEAEFGVTRKRPTPLDDFGEGGEDLRTPTPGQAKAPFSDSPSTWATSPASIGNSSNGSASARPSTAPGSANTTLSPNATSPQSPKSTKSPKKMDDNNDSAPTSPAERHARAATYNGPVDPSLLVPTRNGRDADAVSMSSRRSRNLFKRPSFNQGDPPAKSTSPRRKQTGPSGGLAGAIASSGLAMANPGLTGVPLPDTWSPSRKDTWKDTGSKNAEPPSPPSRKAQHRSPALYGDPTLTIPRSRAGSVSNASDAGDGGFSSAVSDASSSAGGADDSESEDAALLAQLGADIPVTGFAVASNKRNYDFHELFPSVPEGDYLIEDYGCALQRDILIQGRLYISEHHICFHANIFGWVTDVIIPIAEIESVEKRMTAFVIPNALLVSTRTAKYAFASFLARDTVYDVIDNIRKLERPDPDAPPTGEGHDLILTSGTPLPGGTPGAAAAAVQAHKPTQCACGRDGQHYTETALESVLPGTPETIYNLMFASAFMKDFQRNDQKLEDIQISDWVPGENNSLSRNMSYIKPLNGSIGPRSTKCEIRDETVHSDFDDYACTLTTTRTPDVPSGNVFSVKTRTCIMWASAVTSRIIVTSQVEWTGRSFIKGIIERSCIEGQKTYHADLDKAMRAYINAHKNEFLPAGLEDIVTAPDPSDPPTTDALPVNGNAVIGATASQQIAQSQKDKDKQRERERNSRGMQWAYDTFEGAFGVAKRSTSGALDLLSDAWDQTPSTAILWFLIVALIFSNLYTVFFNRKADTERETKRAMYGEARKEMFGYEGGRPTHGRAVEEEWVQQAVQSFLEELAARRVQSGASSPPTTAPTVAGAEDVKAQILELGAALDAVEERIKALRTSLAELD